MARFVLVGFRVGGLMTFAPFFGNASIPLTVKIGLTVLITYLLAPIYAVSVSMALSIGNLLPLALGEIALGLLTGLCVQFVIEGMVLAGQIISFQFGFSLENIIDPTTQVEITVFATLYELVALLVFLQLGAHRWLIRAIGASFRLLPVGSLATVTWPAPELTRAAGALWLIGAEIALPILVVTMLTDFTVGFLGKASPQFPALFFGISAKVLLGLIMLSATIGFWPRLLERHLFHAMSTLESLLTVTQAGG